MSEADALEAQGDTFARSALLSEAARAFDDASRLYREENRHEDALRSMLRLATILMLVGELEEARIVVERGLDLKVAPGEALMMKAAIYDAIGDERAVVAWMTCLQHINDPIQRSLCTCHFIGTVLLRGDTAALDQLRGTLALTKELQREDRIECVGAAGLSARRNGTPLLAQAVRATARHPEAWSMRMAAVWEALVAQVGHELAIDLCALGSRLTMRRTTEIDHGLLMARVELVIKRLAQSRNTALDDFLAQIAEQSDEGRMLDALSALVPQDWIVEL